VIQDGKWPQEKRENKKKGKGGGATDSNCCGGVGKGKRTDYSEALGSVEKGERLLNRGANLRAISKERKN